MRLSERLLVRFNGLSGLERTSVGELTTISGIGPAKAVQIRAALELGLPHGRFHLNHAPKSLRRKTLPIC